MKHENEKWSRRYRVIPEHKNASVTGIHPAPFSLLKGFLLTKKESLTFCTKRKKLGQDLQRVCSIISKSWQQKRFYSKFHIKHISITLTAFFTAYRVLFTWPIFNTFQANFQAFFVRTKSVKNHHHENITSAQPTFKPAREMAHRFQEAFTFLKTISSFWFSRSKMSKLIMASFFTLAASTALFTSSTVALETLHITCTWTKTNKFNQASHQNILNQTEEI